MINLLPPADKKELSAARANRLLLRYLIMFIIFAAIALLTIAASYFYLQSTYNAAVVKESNAISANKTAQTEKIKIESFKSDLATAKQIFDKQTNYSSILLRVSSVIPNGVIIASLELDPSTVGQPTKLQARAKSEAALKSLKDSLNSSDYFENAYYDTVSKQNGNYPYESTISVTFKKELLQ